jgi:hypothetical protein
MVHVEHRGIMRPMKSRLCRITIGISWEIGLGRGEGAEIPPPPHNTRTPKPFFVDGVCYKLCKDNFVLVSSIVPP